MGSMSVRGIRALGRHGADPGERDRLQPFVVDVALDLDLERAAHSDDLADTLDYRALSARIVQTVERTSFALLERLAFALLEVAMEDPRVERAEITVVKPEVLDGATPSVTLSRVR